MKVKEGNGYCIMFDEIGLWEEGDMLRKEKVELREWADLPKQQRKGTGTVLFREQERKWNIVLMMEIDWLERLGKEINSNLIHHLMERKRKKEKMYGIMKLRVFIK